MADNDSLLAAICAPPADDGARLAYSDWLEEHGDAERAEFIRVQCALARLPKRASQAADLRRRQRVLLAANRAEWLGPLKGVAKSLDFQRGFVDCARLSAAELFQHAEALFRHAPLSCLSVREIKAEHTAPLAALPLLGRVRTLRLGTYSTGIGRKGAGPGLAAALASSRHLGNLEELSLDLCGIGVEGARALEAASRLKSLRVLSLVGNWIGAALGRALAAAPFLRHIATLDLSSNNLG
ncbi:MAG TPA: TIGR02996 domain-containing protein, partial [Gemmataceae bacterium]|nr:TIGR02996 domain-containing protein [Gemmataceae bacterium]